MSLHSPQANIAAYRSVSAHGLVSSGDPHALVLALFDAILGRLATARTCIERNEIARKAGVLHSCVILIAELRGSLDMAQGGSIARNLNDLYDYVARRVVHANASNDVGAITEVYQLLNEIREAWNAIGSEVRGHTGGATPG